MFRTAAARPLAFLALIPASASALELTPSDVLVIEFRIDRPSPASSPFGPYDLLALTFPEDFSAIGVTGQKAELFDGGALLGVSRSPAATAYHYWKARDSEWPGLAEPEVDFGTLRTATIDGWIRLSIESGTATILDSSIGLVFGQLTFGGIRVQSPDSAQITGIRIQPVPEPGSAALLIGGAVALVARVRSRSRAVARL